ncbi:MAG TPA: DUF4214 domain-containing protein [Sumerlaeia bacterium]|nr:DUF4214 domain-containing protein [Sumerlaeia bacterium]
MARLAVAVRNAGGRFLATVVAFAVIGIVVAEAVSYRAGERDVLERNPGPITELSGERPIRPAADAAITKMIEDTYDIALGRAPSSAELKAAEDRYDALVDAGVGAFLAMGDVLKRVFITPTGRVNVEYLALGKQTWEMIIDLGLVFPDIEIDEDTARDMAAEGRLLQAWVVYFGTLSQFEQRVKQIAPNVNGTPEGNYVAISNTRMFDILPNLLADVTTWIRSFVGVTDVRETAREMVLDMVESDRFKDRQFPTEEKVYHVYFTITADEPFGLIIQTWAAVFDEVGDVDGTEQLMHWFKNEFTAVLESYFGPLPTVTPTALWTPTPVISPTPVATPVRWPDRQPPLDVFELIRWFYVMILDRNPSEAEEFSWKSGYFDYAKAFNIDARFLPRAMARIFFLSREYDGRYRTDDEFLTDCYRTFMLRDPTEQERRAWLIGDWDRGQVQMIFAESPEFDAVVQRIFPGMKGDPGRNFVTSMYMGILDRLVDKGGVVFFGDRFSSYYASRRDLARWVAESLIFSEEFGRTAPPTKDHVEHLFCGVLGRYPSREETAYWTAELDGGRVSIRGFIDLLVASEEFGARLKEFFETDTEPGPVQPTAEPGPVQSPIPLPGPVQ